MIEHKLTEPRMPEVGASPLLNRKVVDKPLTDPLYAKQQPQLQPQPQPQPSPQPTQPQPTPPFNPLDFEKDASTEHLTQPQFPLNDPNVRAMTFDEIPSDSNDKRDTSGTSSGGSGGDSTVKIPKGEAKDFAEVIVQIGSEYIPLLLSKIACINIAELEALETEQIIPHGSVELFTRINSRTEAALQITEDEQTMLIDAITAYIKWKNIEAANPGTALAIALGVLAIRLGITTVHITSQNKKTYADFLKKNYPTMDIPHEEIPLTKSETEG